MKLPTYCRGGCEERLKFFGLGFPVAGSGSAREFIENVFGIMRELTASIEASGEIILRGSERWAYCRRTGGSEYSRSQLFSGQEIEVVARFSLAGGDPEASDTKKVRGAWPSIPATDRQSASHHDDSHADVLRIDAEDISR